MSYIRKANCSLWPKWWLKYFQTFIERFPIHIQNYISQFQKQAVRRCRSGQNWCRSLVPFISVVHWCHAGQNRKQNLEPANFKLLVHLNYSSRGKTPNLKLLNGFKFSGKPSDHLILLVTSWMKPDPPTLVSWETKLFEWFQCFCSHSFGLCGKVTFISTFRG